MRCTPGASLLPYTTLFRSSLETNIARLVELTSQTQSLMETSAKSMAASSADLKSVAEGFSTTSRDRKSTRLNSSHVASSYAVFCLKKKNQTLYSTGARLQM